MNLQENSHDGQLLTIKLIIYSENQSQLSCIQLAIYSHKSLKDLGMFLYHDEKINFNDFVFTDRPVVGKTNFEKDKKRSAEKDIKLKSGSQLQEQFKVLDGNLTIKQIKERLFVDEDCKRLLMMYSKKEMDAIIDGLAVVDNNKGKSGKAFFPKTYRKSTYHNQCLIF